jgi:hypothetical protein
MTGKPITFAEAHVDHAWPTFAALAYTFRALRGWLPHVPDGVLTAPADGQTYTSFADPTNADAFRAFHHKAATLRVVGRGANLSQAARQRRPVVQRPLVLTLRQNPV